MKIDRNLYVDFHVIQTVPPSCVNRDDTGSPKSAIYGGTNRSRISSQAWKHAMRMMFRDIFENEKIGYRTKNVKSLLVKKLNELAPDKSEEEVSKIADTALEAAKIKSAGDKKDVLFFISTLQVNALAELALEYDRDNLDASEKKKKYKNLWQDALNNNPSVDMLLFGRMSASDADLNCDAAAQVAHCISTHEVSNEYDYFTAVDDCGETTGAGHIGIVEFNASTLYRYATVNVGELYKKMTEDEVSEVLGGFAEAFVKAMPTGKQNTFANRTLPSYIYVAVREDQPINMVGAFEEAVCKSKEGYEKKSIEKFEKYVKNVYDNFADTPVLSWIVSVDNTTLSGKKVKLSELIPQISAAVKIKE